MTEEIDDLFSVDTKEAEASMRLQTMATALYTIGSVVSVALVNKEVASKEDLLEAIEIVYDSVCESAALVELVSETVVH